jgi:hypothetical protein
MASPSRHPPAGAVTLLAAAAVLAALSPAHAQEPPQDLATLFDLGRLVLDTNGDSVPDRVNASLVLGAPPTPTETAAAAEIAARLGFETMAMDLPIARGTGGGIPIVVGRNGLVASGLTSPGVDPTSLETGEGVVAVHEADGRIWVLVVGGDDAGLLAAARLFAGVLPHTLTISAPRLERVREDLTTALELGDVQGGDVRLTQARARAGESGIARLVAEVIAPDPTAAAAALGSMPDSLPPRDSTATSNEATPADSIATPDSGVVADSATRARRVPLAYPGLASVEVRIVGGPVIRLAGRAPPDEPGPVPARSGNGAKEALDLSNLYTTAGLLGGDPFPSRIDALLVPGDSGIAALPDLAARLGLEAIGLTVPIVERASAVARPATQPTLVLAGTGNHLITQLADSGRIDLGGLAPGEGLIELVPKAFGEKPALVVTGSDEAGATRALEQVALNFPNLGERGKDRATVDDVERTLWDALAGYSPIGQAAIGMYKLDRIALDLADTDLSSARVLMSVEKAEPGLASHVRTRAAAALGLDASEVEVTIDDRDVESAATLFEETAAFPSEVERFWLVFRERVLPAASAGRPIRVEARLSEPPEVRGRIEEEARRALVDAGADPAGTDVEVLSAFKQGYSWLYDRIRPQLAPHAQDIAEIVIRFRRNDPPEDWPQQAIHTPVRWLHEIFPIDEVLADELDVPLERIRFEETRDGPTYEMQAFDSARTLILADVFEPKWVLRPYFDRFRDYEQVRVTTGWLSARAGNRTLADERIPTDPETFWDYYQSDVLPAVYDHVMKLHEGLPRGGSIDAPFFGELTLEVEMSEPDHRLGVDNEIHAPLDALHEEVYFGTLVFFDLLGRNSRGQDLAYPGRILPIMRPKSDGSALRARVHLTGFATSRPAVVVAYESVDGEADSVRLDIPKSTLERPSARLAKVRVGETGLAHLGLRVRVDTELDVRDSLLDYAPPETVDRAMVSAEQVVVTLREMEALRAAGMYTSALAFPGLRSLEVWAEWTHEQDSEFRRTGTLAANGAPERPPDWRTLVPDGWTYDGQRLVQWETPMPPPEGHEVLGKLAAAFDEASVYRAGESYLGRDIWAMDLMPPMEASHWSHAKATTFKPTVVYSAREHANEVSSTSHVLRHAELLLTDSTQRAKLDRVNVVVHPFTNPDGAQLAYDLYGITPDYLLHAGYLASLGENATAGSGDDHPVFPEAPVRRRLWETWMPDVFLNPHGYPSHQVVQLFSEYSGLVRGGRVTERNWGLNKGWFMPGFDYVDSPDHPRHRDAAFELRDYITRAINSNPDVFELNRRAYARYQRYGAAFDPEVFRLPMTDSVMIEMPLKGATGEAGNGGFNPAVTIWSGTTEAPDETAYGPWLELVATAGLSWDQAVLDYLAEGDHEVKRSGSSFFGGVTLQWERPRPPEEPDEKEPESAEPPS